MNYIHLGLSRFSPQLFCQLLPCKLDHQTAIRHRILPCFRQWTRLVIRKFPVNVFRAQCQHYLVAHHGSTWQHSSTFPVTTTCHCRLWKTPQTSARSIWHKNTTETIGRLSSWTRTGSSENCQHYNTSNPRQMWNKFQQAASTFLYTKWTLGWERLRW